MTQREIDNLKVGDWLKIANPLSPAAKAHKECI